MSLFAVTLSAKSGQAGHQSKKNSEWSVTQTSFGTTALHMWIVNSTIQQ